MIRGLDENIDVTYAKAASIVIVHPAAAGACAAWPAPGVNGTVPNRHRGLRPRLPFASHLAQPFSMDKTDTRPMKENTEHILRWAVTALANNQEKKASEYYEQYADTIRFANQAAALHHYNLALGYEREDIERGRNLLNKIVNLSEASQDMMVAGDSHLSFMLGHRDKLSGSELRQIAMKAAYYFSAFCKRQLEEPVDSVSQDELNNVDSALRKAQLALSILGEPS